MAYDGTVVVTKIAKNVLKITAPGFDANAEFTVIDLRTYLMEGAQDFTMQVQRTAGAQDVIEMNLQATNDGTNFNTILTETGANDWDSIASKACQQLKLLCTDVGVGNTLTAHIYCTIG